MQNLAIVTAKCVCPIFYKQASHPLSHSANESNLQFRPINTLFLNHSSDKCIFIFSSHMRTFYIIQGFPIRGFTLIYKKNSCFLWKVIWFLFHSIAESLLLIMKNNIIHMASTFTFAGPCTFDDILHYIFAYLRIYFVDNGITFWSLTFCYIIYFSSFLIEKETWNDF